MKKLVLTILTIFYLGVSSGATIHFHHCMGQLVEWGLSDTKSEECNSCGQKESEIGKCCKDQSQQLKVEKSQKAGFSVYEFNQPQVDLSLATFIETEPIFSSALNEEQNLRIESHRTQPVPVFILDCNFRI